MVFVDVHFEFLDLDIAFETLVDEVAEDLKGFRLYYFVLQVDLVFGEVVLRKHEQLALGVFTVEVLLHVFLVRLVRVLLDHRTVRHNVIQQPLNVEIRVDLYVGRVPLFNPRLHYFFQFLTHNSK